MIQYHMFVIKSVAKLDEEECKKYDLHEKYLHDCCRLSKAEFYEVSVDGERHMQTLNGCFDCALVLQSM